MKPQNNSRSKRQRTVELIEQSANRQNWNECRKHLQALCKEVGRGDVRSYDPGTLDNALALLELIEKTRLDEEHQSGAINALHRRLMDYLVVRSSPQSWLAMQAHLEAGAWRCRCGLLVMHQPGGVESK